MKKTVILIIVLVSCIIISFYLAYQTYGSEKKDLSQFNSQFEGYYEKEVYGADLATIINKVIDNNTKYKIEKDQKGNYIDNGKDSIRLEIALLDAKKVYSVEKIYSLGTERFVESYNTAKFKCTKMEYHKKTGKVKYLLFEQTTD